MRLLGPGPIDRGQQLRSRVARMRAPTTSGLEMAARANDRPQVLGNEFLSLWWSSWPEILAYRDHVARHLLSEAIPR